jgi:type IV pilus assembly protein PilY1
MHSRPAVAIYGGTESAPKGLVYATTNDGFLHAIDMNDGTEKWAFIPKEMMLRASSLQRDPVIASRTYGLDGDVRVFKYDADGDGCRGKRRPRLRVVRLWPWRRDVLRPGCHQPDHAEVPLEEDARLDLPSLGDAWSTPVITRVNVKSDKQTDKQKLVAIFGGGYDLAQDGYNTSRTAKATRSTCWNWPRATCCGVPAAPAAPRTSSWPT